MMRWILIAAIAAVALARYSSSEWEWNEEENLLISNSLKLIGNAADRRGCVSDDERRGLFSLNGILEKRNSTHRIVMWQLPTARCRGEK
jgi:hypothetical protein